MPIDSNSKWKRVEISEAEALKAYDEGKELTIGYEPDFCVGFINPIVYADIQSTILFDRHGKIHTVHLEMSGFEIRHDQIKQWFLH